MRILLAAPAAGTILAQMDDLAAPRPGDWGAGRLSPAAEARFVEGVEYCGRFFVGRAEAQKALYR